MTTTPTHPNQANDPVDAASMPARTIARTATIRTVTPTMRTGHPETL